MKEIILNIWWNEKLLNFFAFFILLLLSVIDYVYHIYERQGIRRDEKRKKKGKITKEQRNN